MTTYALQQIYPNQYSLDGLLWEQVTRSGNLPAETVWIHTFEDQGSVNNGDFIAPQTDSKSITFAAGQTTADFDVTILHHGSGDTFSLDILRNPGDSDLNYLAHTTFTIPGGAGGPGPLAPVVNVHDVNLAPGATITGSSLISSISNPSNDSISGYAFWDGGTGNGHFTLNGIAQPDGAWIVESSSSLNSVQYVAGSISGSEFLYVEVYDATTASWSAATSLTATVVSQQVDQTFHAGGGNQTFTGGQGHNTVLFDGAAPQYQFTINGGGGVTSTDSVVGRDGIDILINIEFLQFTDRIVFVEGADGANMARLYSAAFDREPDTAGLSFWENIYSHNISATVKSTGYYIALAQTNDGSGVSIADGFIQSGEFQHLYGALTDAQFITLMYQNVLGRAPDTAGYNFWFNQMEGTGHTTQAMVLVGFAESPENIAKTASGWLISL